MRFRPVVRLIGAGAGYLSCCDEKALQQTDRLIRGTRAPEGQLNYARAARILVTASSHRGMQAVAMGLSY
jgi:hypothetical protein